MESRYWITDRGRALFAKLLAGDTLNISRVTFGSGTVEEPIYNIESLIEPIANGTTSVVSAENGAAKFTCVYRNNLNGGLSEGFYLNEFGVFAFDPDDGEVLIYYANLGDYPQYVVPYSVDNIREFRFPISIIIGNDVNIESGFNPEMWMTADDVYEYVNITILPIFLDRVDEKIAEHNVSEDSHPDIRALIAALDSRVKILEMQIRPDNPFSATFETLDGKTVTGTWNEFNARVEY